MSGASKTVSGTATTCGVARETSVSSSNPPKLTCGATWKTNECDNEVASQDKGSPIDPILYLDSYLAGMGGSRCRSKGSEVCPFKWQKA